jgi:hypothetical protein
MPDAARQELRPVDVARAECGGGGVMHSCTSLPAATSGWQARYRSIGSMKRSYVGTSIVVGVQAGASGRSRDCLHSLIARAAQVRLEWPGCRSKVRFLRGSPSPIHTSVECSARIARRRCGSIVGRSTPSYPFTRCHVIVSAATPEGGGTAVSTRRSGPSNLKFRRRTWLMKLGIRSIST